MPTPKNEERGVGAWIVRWWRALLGELLSTALLVLLGLAAAVPSVGSDGKPKPQPLVHVACSFGFVVIALCEAFGSVCGAHMNPAITLATVLAGRLRLTLAFAYLIAQCLGATLGFTLLGLLSPAESLVDYLGCTQPGTSVSPLSATCIEAILTGMLVLTSCGMWSGADAAGPDRAGSIKIGLTVAGLIYAGGPMTGASLNPARSIGPAIYHGYWTNQWVYWVGPLAGSAVATLLHRFVLSPRRAPSAPSATAADSTELPLHDKRDV